MDRNRSLHKTAFRIGLGFLDRLFANALGKLVCRNALDLKNNTVRLLDDGCDFTGNAKKGGLTDFGQMLVKEAESLNMIIDLSHLSDEGVDDVLSITSCPLIASHSNARAVAHNNRNLKDEHLKEIARRGGVVGLNACSIIPDAGVSFRHSLRRSCGHSGFLAEYERT